MKYFIGDTHFGHVNLIHFETGRRQFVTIEAHDRFLVEAWNATVGPKDIVYHLGDVFFGAPPAASRPGTVPAIGGAMPIDIKLDPAFLAKLDDPSVPDDVKAKVRETLALMRQAGAASATGEEFLAAMERLGKPVRPVWRPKYGYYLSLDRRAKDILAVISDGSPQHGHPDPLVLDVATFATAEEAHKWFDEAVKRQPWVGHDGCVEGDDREREPQA